MTPTRINGKWKLNLLPDRHDFHTKRPDWESKRLAHMAENIKAGDILFDIGAEEGDLSALYASWGAKLVLFEPSPAFWPRIRDTFEANNFTPLAANQMFISDENHQPLWPTYAYPIDEGFRHVNEHAGMTPSTTLDAYCAVMDTYPDVLMIDVEGSEFKVLQGARRLLTHLKPKVYVSVHNEIMLDRYNTQPKRLHNYMKKMGYTGTKLDNDHEEDWIYVKA